MSVEVKLTSAPASAVTVPVTHTPQGATSSGDYSGVPANVMFSAGETSKAFTFTATQDTVDDDGESVLLAFGTLPPEVSAGNSDRDDGQHHRRRRRAGGEGGPGADAGDDQRERDGKCEHGYGERTVGVQRGHDGHGVGEPGGHHDADREHDPDHPGGGHEQHGGGDHHGGERRRLHREPDGGGERDGGEQRGDNRPGRRDADDHRRRHPCRLRERRHLVWHREVCR